MGKKRTNNQKFGVEAEAALKSAFSEWVVNELNEDFGLDFVVQLARPTGEDYRELTSLSCFIQLKASNDFDGDAVVRKSVDTSFLESYWNSSVPVLFVFYEDSSDDLFWCCIQDYVLEELFYENPSWWGQESVTIKADRGSKLTDIDELGREIERLSQKTSRYLSMHQELSRLGEVNREIPTVHHLATYQSKLLKNAKETPEDNPRRRKYLLNLLSDSFFTIDIHSVYETKDTQTSRVIYFFKIYEVCSHALDLSEGLNEELEDFFEDKLAEIQNIIITQMVGDTYLNCKIDEIFTIVAMSELGDRGGEPIWMAELQYEDGVLSDENARAIAQRPDYKLIDSDIYEDSVARHNSCGDGNHKFNNISDRNDVEGEFPICTECGLSTHVMVELCHEEPPVFCDNCGKFVEETELEKDILVCIECKIND